MNRTQIIASAIGATLLALGPAATAEVTTTTTPIGETGCHVEWHDSETGAPLGWADTPSQACDEFVPVDDATFTGIVIDTGDGIATTGLTEAAPCLAAGTCVEVLPGVHVAAHEAPAVSEWLVHTAVTSALDAWFWVQIAECESGGRWDLVQRGRRPSGALQITDGTWQAYGGHEYAARAGQASQAEQIIVARRIHDAEGIEPWGVCGRRAS